MTTITFAFLVNWSADGVTFIDESAYIFHLHLSIGMRDRYVSHESADEQLSAAFGTVLGGQGGMGFGALMAHPPAVHSIGQADSPVQELRAVQPTLSRAGIGGGHRVAARPGKPSQSSAAHHSGSGRHRGGAGKHVKARKPKPPKHYPHQIGHAPRRPHPHQHIPKDNGPIEYVADLGTCDVTLDNSSQRFSPDYASGPLFGSLLPRRAVKVTATDGVSNWTLFSGFIERIEPEPGIFSSRHVVIACIDAIGLLAFQKVSLPLQVNQRADQIIAQLVAATYTPTATNYQPGSSSFDLAADQWSADRTPALDAIRECCESEFGRFFIQRDGTPTFYARRTFFAPPSPAVTLGASDPFALTVGRDVEQVFNLIKVDAHPRNTLSAPQVLAQANAPVLIPPIGPAGAGIRYLTLHFHDATGNPLGGTNLTIPLAANIDYVVNEKKDNSGVYYTTSSYFTIQVVDVRGSEVTIEMTNSALGVLYATTLQIRGQAVTSYDPITQTAEDTVSEGLYQKRAWTHDLPLSADVDLAYALSRYLLNRYAYPFTRIDAVTIHNDAVIEGADVFEVKLFDPILSSEAQTGLSNVLAWVIGQRLEITPDTFTLTWLTERADDKAYWIVGTSALGTNTALAV